jgi:hypothetical protein
MNKRDQILIQKTVQLLESAGIQDLLPPVNFGRVDNKGYEFLCCLYGKLGRDLAIQAGDNGGYAKNKCIYMDRKHCNAKLPEKGRQTNNSYLVYQSDGAFRDQADIDKIHLTTAV